MCCFIAVTGCFIFVIYMLCFVLLSDMPFLAKRKVKGTKGVKRVKKVKKHAGGKNKKRKTTTTKGKKQMRRKAKSVTKRKSPIVSVHKLARLIEDSTKKSGPVYDQIRTALRNNYSQLQNQVMDDETRMEDEHYLLSRSDMPTAGEGERFLKSFF